MKGSRDLKSQSSQIVQFGEPILSFQSFAFPQDKAAGQYLTHRISPTEFRVAPDARGVLKLGILPLTCRMLTCSFRYQVLSAHVGRKSNGSVASFGLTKYEGRAARFFTLVSRDTREEEFAHHPQVVSHRTGIFIPSASRRRARQNSLSSSSLLAAQARMAPERSV
jgi:hypothetical protein